MQTFFQDLRYGIRMLLTNRGFAISAVLTLALGIGANTAVFSVINGVMVKPLPFRDPGRLVWIAPDGTGGLSATTTQVGNFSDWREINRSLNHSFDDLCAYFAFFDYSSYVLTGKGEPQRLHGVGVTQNFLHVLGVEPQMGRDFVPEECVWNGSKAVLLSDSLWRARFSAEKAIVGHPLLLNNESYVVVGVLPPSFDFSSIFTPGTQVDFLLPFPICDETDHWGNTLSVIGRLKPSATLASAQAEFDAMNKQLDKAHPERSTPSGKITPLQKEISGAFYGSFAVLSCAVGAVLLIGCVNLSNLLLARSATRRKEIAVRAALGASRWRLIRQMLTESMLISSSGAAVGLLLAIWATKAFVGIGLFNIPLLQAVRVDLTTLGFTLLVAVLTGVLFGVIPALQISGLAIAGDLKQSGRGYTAERASTRLRDALVVSEVAMACILLVTAGLFVRSFQRLLDVNPGFRAEGAVAWPIETARHFDNRTQETAYYQDLVNHIKDLPGVESAGLTDTLPLGRNRSWIAGAKGEFYPEDKTPVAFPRVVDSNYLRAMRIPLLAGRSFDARDTEQSEPVLIANETMAKGLWPGKEAVGQVAVVNGNDFRVIGVAGNVRHSALQSEASPEMYILGNQRGWGSMDLVVRTKGSVSSVLGTVKAALRQVDPDLPTAQFQTLEQIVDRSLSSRRFITFLLAAFGMLALVLASLGIYAVISYSVNQRTHEIGIRLALGASAPEVVLLIVRRGFFPALLGLGIGIAGTLAIARVLVNQLYEVKPSDPLTFVGVASVLLVVGLAACFVPARRATRIDPVSALRQE